MSYFPKHIVLAPIDFSDESLHAVEVALSVAASPGGVHVVHVLPDLAVIEPGVAWQTIDDQTRRTQAEIAFRERMSDPRYAKVQMHILIGDPGREITDLAQNLGVELIVMPSHGRRGLSRLLIGSVAERVIRLAHCPVLVLRK